MAGIRSGLWLTQSKAGKEKSGNEHRSTCGMRDSLSELVAKKKNEIEEITKGEKGSPKREKAAQFKGGETRMGTQSFEKALSRLSGQIDRSL